MERLRHRALAHGLHLLADQWHGAHVPYAFRCAHGHTFHRTVATLRVTGRCPQCDAQALAARFAQALAHHGLTCAEPYTNGKARYNVRCPQGHTWSSLGHQIVKGGGCPTCGRAARAQASRRMRHWDHLRALAVVRGGRCLSDAYLGIARRYTWQCARGHVWQASGTNVLHGTWCRRCADAARGLARRSPDTLKRLRALARAKGGACLSNEDLGSDARYTFRCAQGHRWTTLGRHILHGRWCGRCASDRQRRLSVADLQRIAAGHGGRCLSNTYENLRTKVTWQCHRGHVWHAVPAHILYGGSWCPNCFRLRQARDPIKRLRYDVHGRG